MGRFSLYADDMLIYLEDPQSSLPVLLEIIQRFGHFSGFRVNWDKSLLFQIDRESQIILPPACPLQIVTTFRYLGVLIEHPISSYTKINLDPLITRLKSTLKTWNNLPLTLLGRINIFKMIYLPRFLYILSNSPIYITKAKFKEIDSIIINFLWKGGVVKIAKHTLQLPILEGGLALPCLQTYYIASQLMHAHWWFFPEANNAATALEAAILTSYESLQNLIHRMSLRGREGVNILSMTLQIFKISKLIPISTQAVYSPNAPLRELTEDIGPKKG